MVTLWEQISIMFNSKLNQIVSIINIQSSLTLVLVHYYQSFSLIHQSYLKSIILNLPSSYFRKIVSHLNKYISLLILNTISHCEIVIRQLNISRWFYRFITDDLLCILLFFLQHFICDLLFRY